MTRRRIYTFEVCQELVKLHPTRNKLSKAMPNAYAAAQRAGWLDALYPPETRPKQPEAWTKDRVAEVSKLYASRSEMHSGPHQWALKVARNNGWLDVLPPVKRRNPIGHWSKSVCKKDAAKYKTKSEWCIFSKAGYQAAYRNNWLDECCSHMISVNTSDNDIFYLWKAKDTFYNGCPVYKFGITSERLEKKRIRDVAKAAGLEPEVLLYIPLEQAPQIERIASSLGHNPCFDHFDGYTEFRAYSQEDIAQILAAVHTAGKFVL